MAGGFAINQSAWRISQRCGNHVVTCCQKETYSPAFVFPVVFSQSRLELAIPDARVLRGTPAFSIGGLMPRIEVLNVVLVAHDTPVGVICLEEGFESTLSDDEREFVVAHEYSHIVLNHSPLLALGNVASSIVEDYISSVEDEMTELALRVAWSYIQVNVGIAFGKQSELDADGHAVSVTGKRTEAVSTIESMARRFAGSLESPSHVLVRGRYVIPVLTYRDRIEHLGQL